MQIVNDVNCFSINNEFQNSNSIYKVEIFRLIKKLKSMLKELENFCSEVDDYGFDLPLKKSNVIKKSKLKEKYHLNMFFETLKQDDELMDKYNSYENKIDINMVYILYNNMIQRYYDAINLIRLLKQSNDSKTNIMFDSYNLEYSEKHIERSIYAHPKKAICYIADKIVYDECVDMINNYFDLKQEQTLLSQNIYEIQSSIEKYMRAKRKEVLSIEELRRYKNLLLDVKEELVKNGSKQKRID